MSKSRLPLGLTLFLIFVLLLPACAPAAAVDGPGVPRSASPTPTLTASPTPPRLPVAVQPTQVAPIDVPLQARLAVIASRARVTRGGSLQEVQQAQSADIQIDDGIEMVTLDGQNEQSYGILHIPDSVNLELFGNTKLVLAEAKQGAESPVDLTLDLADGHLFVHLNEKSPIRVTVQTSYATLKSLTNGAEFDVCHNEALTCVMVKTGIVEIVARGGREIVRAGTAVVVLKDQPMSPVICAPVSKFIAWEEGFRLFADAPALQEEIAALPQKACPLGTNGLPLHARILYRDEFGSASKDWDQGTIDHFTVRYIHDSGARYYQVQSQGPQGRFLAFVPDQRDYEDVNIDLKTRTEAAGGGDFFYGLVFRRSGNQYYAFIVSPPTDAWYFLKSSSQGMEFLKHGSTERLRGLDGQDTLRVETHGSTFLVFINDWFIDWVSDPDYPSGEVGLFVETIDNPDALINFNSITIWDVPAPVFNPQAGENCFNALDDDGDGLIDQADPACQRPELVETSSLTPSFLPTSTPRTIATPTAMPPATDPPAPTATNRPPPATRPPLPTLSLPTLIVPLPTISLPTISLPLPTIILPLPGLPPAGTPAPG